MGTMTYKICDEKIRKCLDMLTDVRKYAPSESSLNDLYLMQWAVFKRRIATAAAHCVKEFLGDLVQEIYYIELSDSYTGRDIDLYIVLDEKKAEKIDARELEETIETVLTKLANLAEIDIHSYTDAPSVFEVHTSIGGLYGSKKLPRSVRAIKLYP